MVTTSKWMTLNLINGWSKSYLGDTLTFPLSRRPLWALCKYTNTQFLMHQSFKRTKWFSLYFIFLYEWVPQEGLGWPSYIRDEFLKPKISLVNLIWDIAPCVNEVNHHTLVSWGKSPNVNWEKSPNVSWGKSQIPVEGKCALYWMRLMMFFPREANLGLTSYACLWRGEYFPFILMVEFPTGRWYVTHATGLPLLIKIFQLSSFNLFRILSFEATIHLVKSSYRGRVHSFHKFLNVFAGMIMLSF